MKETTILKTFFKKFTKSIIGWVKSDVKLLYIIILFYDVTLFSSQWHAYVAISDPGSMKLFHILEQSPYNWSKYSSDSFPHTKYMSQCLENSQNHTLMFCCSPIPGRRFEKQGKLWDYGGGRPMRGLELIMWPQGQWTTDMATLWLNQPSGADWVKILNSRS